MNTFDFVFAVRAPLTAVAAFHRDPGVLKRLTMPPVAIEVHEVQPLAEGSTADFTLWMGHLPIRWRARHTTVDPLLGFRDTQVHGPMKRWVHDRIFSVCRLGSGTSVGCRLYNRLARGEYRSFPDPNRGKLTDGIITRPIAYFTNYGDDGKFGAP